MGALADTSVLIDYLRGFVPARELIRGAIEGSGVVWASSLTRIELSIGMRRDERRRTDALVAALRFLPVDAVVAEEADALARRYGPSPRGSTRSTTAWRLRPACTASSCGR